MVVVLFLGLLVFYVWMVQKLSGVKNFYRLVSNILTICFQWVSVCCTFIGKRIPSQQKTN